MSKFTKRKAGLHALPHLDAIPGTPTSAPKTFWNGLPTPALRGTAVVAPAPEFPQYWAADLVGQRIAVVLVVLDGVNYGGGTSYLDDRDGSGWAKVTEGHGGPRWPHSDVAIVPDSFMPATTGASA